MMALLGMDQLQEELDILSSKHYYRYGFCHRYSHCQFEQNRLWWISSLACNTTNWRWKWFSLMVQQWAVKIIFTDGSLYQLLVKMANGGPNVVLLRVADRQGPLACPWLALVRVGGGRSMHPLPPMCSLLLYLSLHPSFFFTPPSLFLSLS
jgi:hypothetical protein